MVNWHGVKPNEADWGGRYLAWVLEAFQTEARSDFNIYVGSNTYWEPMEVELPAVEGKRWFRVVDTSLLDDQDIVTEEEAVFVNSAKYTVGPRAMIVLIAK